MNKNNYKLQFNIIFGEKHMEYIEEFDKLKTKVLKYIMFKKRTEQEVRQKFREESIELLNDVIEELKELEYINDENYIKRAINEFKNLKTMSIKEIEYKLMTKGIKKDIINKSNYKEFGARKIDKIIKGEIESMIINKILDGEIGELLEANIRR